MAYRIRIKKDFEDLSAESIKKIKSFFEGIIVELEQLEGDSICYLGRLKEDHYRISHVRCKKNEQVKLS